jgi:hypothetical protein
MPTLTIEVTAQQGARIAEAVGAKQTIPPAPVVPATLAECRADLIKYLRQTVQEYEEQKALKSVVPMVDLV